MVIFNYLSYKSRFIKVSLFLLFLTPFNILAQTSSSFKNIEKKAINADIKISETIEDLAERLDLFLSGRNYSAKRNETSVRLIGFAQVYEGGDFRGDTAVDVNLRLPNVEENFNLMVSSTEPNDFNSLDRRLYGAVPGARKYGAGLGLLKTLGKFDTLFQPRINLTNPLTTFYLLKFTSKGKAGRWTLRPEFRFFADSEQGTGQSAALYFDFEWHKNLIFRWIDEEQYFDLQDYFSTNFGPMLLYNHSDRTVMGMSLTFNSNNRPVYYLDHYLWIFSVRHELYKKMLFVQVAPSLLFNKSYGFKGDAGYSLTVEVLF